MFDQQESRSNCKHLAHKKHLLSARVLASTLAPKDTIRAAVN
jgi:hypothetical protein